MNKLPNHIAFIMDGNGRWAALRGMPRNYGHKKGLETVETVLDCCLSKGIKVVSLYVFSTENWQRPKSEIDGLFDLARRYLGRFTEFCKKNIKVVVSGEVDGLPQSLAAEIVNIQKQTAANSAMTVNLCINYGGRKEIAAAFNKAVSAGVTRFEEETLRKYLYNDLPDPDLIVRTGGQMRLSNYLLYQSAYSELFFTDVLWPDFSEKDIANILEIYSRRCRNFGGLNKKC